MTTTTTTIPNLQDASLSPSLRKLAEEAKVLFQEKLLMTEPSNDKSTTAWITVAPGRVNLIGEHTDYTGGFVLPFAIDYSTLIYGTGTLVQAAAADTEASKIVLRFVSTSKPEHVIEHTLTHQSQPPEPNSGSSWTWYVIGTVAQYLPDLPTSNIQVELNFSIAGDVPLGSGLSSSASLEVAVARFVECILGEKYAFSSALTSTTTSAAEKEATEPKWRALRCQKAENVWCYSPCGIMDQYVSSAAASGSLLLIDCRSLEYQTVTLPDSESVVLVVANSNVKHDIAGGEYPIRVAQCKTATKALQDTADDPSRISQLRDATLEDVELAREKMDDVSFRRARHVVTENARTLACQMALEAGDYVAAGKLMHASHVSMRDDYEVSCDEIDALVELAMSVPGVYGSRLTGGGFGGCTVTLVQKDSVQPLLELLQMEYPKRFDGLICDCFVTSPGPGARLVAQDTI